MIFAQLLTYGPPLAFALAVVATAGYLLGRRSRPAGNDSEATRRDLRRAKAVIRELERISQDVRRNLATHHGSVLQFKDRINVISRNQESSVWRELSEEAERMLRPTLALSTKIAHAYDEIRQQTNLLMSFTEVRTDPLTGLSNRRAMEETLRTLFAMKQRYRSPFSLGMIDIDHFKKLNDENGHLFGDQILQQFAQMLDESIRETDCVARFGGEEFVVIMPETDLWGACVFAERFRQRVAAQMPITISTGITLALNGDTPESLVSRADTALYSAKSTGRNCVYQHCGKHIQLVELADDLEDETEDETEGEKTMVNS